MFAISAIFAKVATFKRGRVGHLNYYIINNLAIVCRFCNFLQNLLLQNGTICHLIWYVVENLAINRHFCHFRQNRQFQKGSFGISFDTLLTIWRWISISAISPKSPLPNKRPLRHLLWYSVNNLTNQFIDLLPVCLLAQLVERCIGIAVVKGWNLVQAWIFSGFLFATAKVASIAVMIFFHVIWRLLAIPAIFAKIATFKRAPLPSHLNFC